MTRSNTKEEFVINAQKIHQNRYDYSKSIYKGSDTKIEIICSIHGSFWQTPNKHIYAHQNCPKCNLSQKITLEMFLEKANNIHKNKYDYSFITEINGYNSKITIICQIHKKFFQSVQKHLFGRGCPRCGGSIKSTKEEFIEKAIKTHENKYDYSKVYYVNANTKVEIKCNKCETIFKQKPNAHVFGNGCKNCAIIINSKKQRKSIETFLNEAKEVHGNEYDYSLVDYKNWNTKIKIICNYCEKIFEQRPFSHLKGAGCLTCSGGPVSKMEIKWLDYLGIPQEYRNIPIYINDQLKKPDAIDKENKIIWEFYGDFYHGNPKKFPPEKINYINKQTFGELYQKTIEKKIFLKNAGFKLITIWESDWKSLKINDLNF